MHCLTCILSAFALLAMPAYSQWSAQGDLTQATEIAPPEFKELLRKYATPQGVRYATWHVNPNDREALRNVVAFYANTLPPQSHEASLAWHLNAYNAWILHNILAKYPTSGPLDGEHLFFEGNHIVISGKKTSFDHLEQKVIRPKFKEPRIHFALNCASESCPPLHTKPFTTATLNADLNRLTHAFINANPQGVVVEEGKVHLSKLFEWYAADFGGKDQLISYINRYRDPPLPTGVKVFFLDYSWKLNALD